MPEFLRENQESDHNEEYSHEEYINLLSHASAGIENLSSQERERLVDFGNYYLEVEDNTYEAIKAFQIVQNFEGLRKVADQLLQKQPDNYDLSRVLTLLEDHEGIHNLLNRDDIKLEKFTYERTFDSLDQPLREYIRKFFQEIKHQ